MLERYLCSQLDKVKELNQLLDNLLFTHDEKVKKLTEELASASDILGSIFSDSQYAQKEMLARESLQDLEQAIGRTKRTLVDVAYAALELRAISNMLSPERYKWGTPVWPPEVELVHGRHPLAGKKGELCYRTVCQRPSAWYYNRGSHRYYCEACAKMLNRENFGETFSDGRPMVVFEGPDMEHVPVTITSPA